MRLTLLALLTYATGAWCAVPYVYPTYATMLSALRSLEAAHPDLVDVWSAQDAYGVASPGSCGPVPCEHIVVRVTNETSLKDPVPTSRSTRPAIFFSGNLHGNEAVGPPTLLALLETLVTAAATRSNPWLAMLVNTREVWAMPITNPFGYYNNERTENGFDPNRDFPYATSSMLCMRTATARAVNEVFRETMFQLAVTFHGGSHQIAYEWGSPNHETRGSESPDDAAMAAVASVMSSYAGSFMGQSYPTGRLNPTVYPVPGGMEDWAYAASWDAGASTPCRPSTPAIGSYDVGKTTYTPSMLRTYNVLVEAWASKQPAEGDLGTNEDVLTVGGRGDGHVPRNLRLSLAVIDLVEPWVVWTTATFSRKLSGAGCAARLTRRLGMRRLGSAAAAWRSVRQYIDKYDHVVLANVTEGDDALSSLMASLTWDVGGGVNADATTVVWGLWPSHVVPDMDADLSPEWYAFIEDPSRLPSTAVAGDPLHGATRWGTGATPGNFGTVPFSPRFASCATLELADPSAPSVFVAVATATLDSGWTRQVAPDPAVSPQSHIANARTNSEWSMSYNGRRVVGRTSWVSAPKFIAVIPDLGGDLSWVSRGKVVKVASVSCDDTECPQLTSSADGTPKQAQLPFWVPGLTVYAVVATVVMCVALGVIARRKWCPPLHVAYTDLGPAGLDSPLPDVASGHVGGPGPSALASVVHLPLSEEDVDSNVTREAEVAWPSQAVVSVV